MRGETECLIQTSLKEETLGRLQSHLNIGYSTGRVLSLFTEFHKNVKEHRGLKCLLPSHRVTHRTA